MHITLHNYQHVCIRAFYKNVLSSWTFIHYTYLCICFLVSWATKLMNIFFWSFHFRQQKIQFNKIKINIFYIKEKPNHSLFKFIIVELFHKDYSSFVIFIVFDWRLKILIEDQMHFSRSHVGYFLQLQTLPKSLRYIFKKMQKVEVICRYRIIFRLLNTDFFCYINSPIHLAHRHRYRCNKIREISGCINFQWFK